MSKIANFAITFIALIYLQRSSGFECVDIDPPITRTFDSILKFQANKIGFLPEDEDFEGNHVKFDFITIDRLPRNAFIAFDSDHVINLSLDHKNIQQIDDEAFTGLKCLSTLDLSTNNISELSTNTFQDLGRLQKLDISDNNLEVLPRCVFSKLQTLQTLNLSRNHIKTIRDPMTFCNLTSLEVLDLSHNRLKVISPESLQVMQELEYLNLGSNRLRYLQIQDWDRRLAITLEVLDLSNNSLSSLNLNVKYNFYNIRSLNLSFNDLEEIDIHALRDKFRVLETIDINHNRLPCDALAFIKHELWDLKITYYGPGNSAKTMNDIACLGNPSKDLKPILPTQNQSHVPETTSNLTSAYLQEIVKGNNRNTRLMNQVMESVGRTENLVVYLYTLSIIALAVFVIAKTGICGKLAEMLCDGRRRHLTVYHQVDDDRNHYVPLVGRR